MWTWARGSASRSCQRVDLVADEIVHRPAAARQRGRAGRQAADGADVLLELRGDGALDRPVAAVVDARRDLVDERAVGAGEELDGEDADVAERFGDAERRRRALPRPAPRSSRRGGTVEVRRMPSRWTLSAQSQKAWRPSAQRATMTENSAIEGDASFGDGGFAADGSPGGFGLIGRADPGLALAVIAVAAGLEDDGHAEFGDRAARHRRGFQRRATERPGRRWPR